jgi:hypothetical protein
MDLLTYEEDSATPDAKMMVGRGGYNSKWTLNQECSHSQSFIIAKCEQRLGIHKN